MRPPTCDPFGRLRTLSLPIITMAPTQRYCCQRQHRLIRESSPPCRPTRSHQRSGLPASAFATHGGGHSKTEPEDKKASVKNATAYAHSGGRRRERQTDYYDDNGVEQRLREWIEDAGGFIHPALEIADPAPSGARGVVAVRDVPLEEARELPMVVVPVCLYLSTDDMADTVKPIWADADVAAKFAALPVESQLALAVAWEAAKGERSRYGPYLDTLPATPSCAWALDDEALEKALLHLAGADSTCDQTFISGLRVAARDARVIVSGRCANLAAIFGSSLGLTASDIQWAYGQVLSRSFGNSESGVGMAPFIDLINHSGSASVPVGFEGTDGTSLVYVPSVRAGEPAALQAGEELYINYMSRKADPTELFLTYGFIPQESMALVHC